MRTVSAAMAIARDDSLLAVTLVPLFVGVVGLLLGLTVGPLVGGLGFVVGVGGSLVIGANVDSDDTQERIEELEARVDELEGERDDG